MQGINCAVQNWPSRKRIIVPHFLNLSEISIAELSPSEYEIQTFIFATCVNSIYTLCKIKSLSSLSPRESCGFYTNTTHTHHVLNKRQKGCFQKCSKAAFSKDYSFSRVSCFFFSLAESQNSVRARTLCTSPAWLAQAIGLYRSTASAAGHCWG